VHFIVVICKQDFLASENKGRWTTYHLNTEYKSEDWDIDSEFENKGNTSEDKGNTSSFIKGNTSEDKGNTSSFIKGNTSEDKGNTSSSFKGNTSEDEGDTKQRLTKDELHKRILKICELDFYSVVEIAQRADKDVNYLKKTVIPEMIDKNLLVRLFPSIINHPQQKYKKQD
jgi:ATP-dependent DNA helicase RecG